MRGARAGGEQRAEGDQRGKGRKRCRVTRNTSSSADDFGRARETLALAGAALAVALLTVSHSDKERKGGRPHVATAGRSL